MEEEQTTPQEIAGVRLVCQLEDVLDTIEEDRFEPVARNIIGKTLDLVQHHYYLVPKLAEGGIPEGSIDSAISNLWNSVSN